jgi:diketogulonate reductase-like aldo/keto reductase
MTLTIESTVTLNNGVAMPRLGFGTFETPSGDATRQAGYWALETGYRAIDTAAYYGNEADVGEAVRTSGVARDDVFITTKAWVDSMSYDGAKAAFDESMRLLGVETLDLYLIHWPANDWQGAWRAFEEIYDEGRVRAIGVSNFMPHHLDELFTFAEVTPAVNQVELHPRLQQKDLQDYCRERDIAVTAWSPLMKGDVLDIPELVEIGERHGKNGIHVTLRWMLQIGLLTIPKSAKRDHIKSNADLFDFELSDDEIATINALDQDQRIGIHPDRFSA